MWKVSTECLWSTPQNESASAVYVIFMSDIIPLPDANARDPVERLTACFRAFPSSAKRGHQKAAKKVFPPPGKVTKNIRGAPWPLCISRLAGACRTALRTSLWFGWKINERSASEDDMQSPGERRRGRWRRWRHLSLPKSKFERTDDVARQGSDPQQCLRTARSDVCRARPSRAKHAFAPRYNRWHISQGFGDGDPR